MKARFTPSVLQYRPTFCLCLLFLFALLVTLRLTTATNTVLAIVSAAACVALTLLRRKYALPLRVPVFAALLALASVLSCLDHIPARALAGYTESEIPVVVQVESVTYEGGTSLYFDGTVTELDGKRVRIKSKFYCYDAPCLTAGDVATAMAEITPLSSYGQASQEDIYLLSCGFKATATLTDATAVEHFVSPSLLFSRLRDTLSARLSSSLSEESGGLLSALLFGDRSGVSPVLNRDMSRIGILHLLAISGMHFTVLFIGLEKFLGKLGVGKHMRLGFVAVASVFYLGLTGFSSAIARAGFMLLIMILSFYFRQHYDSLTSLGVSLFLICLFTPYAVYHTGLWLSALSTFGILALQEKRQEDIKEKPSFRLSRYLLDSIVVTAAALLMTAPLTAFVFGTFPLMTPVANLLLGPLITVLLYVAPLLLLFPNAMPLIRLTETTVSIFKEGTALLASFDTVLPVSHPLIRTLFVLTASVIVCYFCLSTRKKVSFVFPTAVLLLGAILMGGSAQALALAQRGRTEIAFYAEEQTANGEMLLLSTEGEHGVIDGTKGKWRLYDSFLSYANEKHIYEFDFYVLTSYAQAESSGFLYLMDSQRLGTLYLPSPINAEEEVLLSALEERAAAAGTELVLYGEEAFSPSPSGVTLCSLSVIKNRYLSLPAFSIVYGDCEVLYFSASFSYDPSHYARIEGADAVFFGACGASDGKTPFFATAQFPEVDFYCSNQNKTPFRDPAECTEGLVHEYVLRKTE